MPDGSPVARRLAGRRLVLLRRGERVLVADELCPHRGASLSVGEVDGWVVDCVAHHWRFDLEDGRCLDADSRLRTYPVAIRDGRVLVTL